MNTAETEVNHNNNNITNDLEETEANNNFEDNANDYDLNIIKEETFDIYEVELYLDEVDNAILGTIYNTEDGGQFFLDCNSGAYGHDGVATDSDICYNLYCGTYTADDSIQKVTINGEDTEIIKVDDRILWFYKYKGEEFADVDFIDE